MDQEKLLSRYGRVRLPAVFLKHGKVPSELRIVPFRNSQLTFTYHGHPRIMDIHETSHQESQQSSAFGTES